jgi:ssDNA-binding Zn-finger/Zn-ribbon topoisomerase 1
MLTDDYNGICPKCGFNRMCVRYGSMGYYQFDACSKCGFAYGTNHYDGEDKDEEVWKVILGAEGDLLVEKGLPRTRGGYHAYIMSLPEPTEALRGGSVFVHKEFQKPEEKK